MKDLPKTPKNNSYPGISIIIPNLNGQKYLSQLIYSLKKAIKNCPQTNFEIILVDNNSQDLSLDIFQKELQPLSSSMILNQKNLGFAAAVNQGIKKAKYSWVCLLNNDLRLHPDFFKHFRPYLKKAPQYQTLCGTILDDTATFIESQGIRFHTSGKCTQIQHHQTPKNDKKAHEVWVYKREFGEGFIRENLGKGF